jgi:catechol 2,3-dioxygenase-like lactoylglutathione lyase family enzyme
MSVRVGDHRSVASSSNLPLIKSAARFYAAGGSLAELRPGTRGRPAQALLLRAEIEARVPLSVEPGSRPALGRGMMERAASSYTWGNALLVARDGHGELVGLAATRRTGLLDAIGTDGSTRGAGAALLLGSVAGMHRRRLHLISTPAARSFYAAMGLRGHWRWDAVLPRRSAAAIRRAAPDALRLG